jgi:hypothetical protein
MNAARLRRIRSFDFGAGSGSRPSAAPSIARRSCRASFCAAQREPRLGNMLQGCRMGSVMGLTRLWVFVPPMLLAMAGLAYALM